jgi:hypothetical protein
VGEKSGTFVMNGGTIAGNVGQHGGGVIYGSNADPGL